MKDKERLIGAVNDDKRNINKYLLHQYAWRRYLARLTDLVIYPTLLIVALIIIGSQLLPEAVVNELTFFLEKPEVLKELENKFSLFNLLFHLFVIIFILPLNYHCFSTTIGKKLFGIKILDSNENPLKFKQACNREVLVLFKGTLFYPISSIYQYIQFVKNETVSWDKNLKLIIVYNKMNFISFIWRILISILILLSCVALSLWGTGEI